MRLQQSGSLLSIEATWYSWVLQYEGEKKMGKQLGQWGAFTPKFKPTFLTQRRAIVRLWGLKHCSLSHVGKELDGHTLKTCSTIQDKVWELLKRKVWHTQVAFTLMCSNNSVSTKRAGNARLGMLSTCLTGWWPRWPSICLQEVLLHFGQTTTKFHLPRSPQLGTCTQWVTFHACKRLWLC